MLRNLPVKAVYKTEFDDILKDFYVPALSSALRYDRAVGFFSASALNHAAQGLSAFVSNGGSIRLLVGAFVDEDDLEAVKLGYERKKVSQTVESQFLQEMDSGAGKPTGVGSGRNARRPVRHTRASRNTPGVNSSGTGIIPKNRI